MGTEVTALTSYRSVTYDTYANFPTSPAVEDLAYATDRRVLYRWSGAAWQYLTQYHGFGVAGDIPAAADLPDGSTYYETDTLKTQQVQTASWVEINAAPPPAVQLTVVETQVFNGTSPTSWTDLNLSGTIGAKASFVILKFMGNFAEVAVRKNGDTDEFYSADIAEATGCALAGVPSGTTYIILIAVTDASGRIEWRTDVGITVTIDVVAYIN